MNPDSLTAKPESFGVALRAAIKEEFGSGREFAKALGVSPGRVSQIIGAPVDIDPKTLLKVLHAFSSPALQTRIHAAWVQEFVPLPTDALHSIDSEAASALAHLMWQSDLPKRALEVALAHRDKVTDPALWQELSGLAALVNLRLGRPGAALSILGEMERRFHEDGEQGHLLAVLWMKGLAYRNVEGMPLKKLDGVHREALQYALAHEPAGDWKERWTTKKLELTRDFALHVLAVNELRPVALEVLEHAWKGLESAIVRWEDESAAAMGLEVRARLEVAMGQRNKAEDTLDEVLARTSNEIMEIEEKIELVRARIAIERRDLEEAKARLIKVSDSCLEKMNLHHYRVADQLLARLETGILPGSRM